MLEKVICNVLTAVYQPFWFAITLTILYMYVWKNGEEIKTVCLQCLKSFKEDVSFRKMTGLVFYSSMILFRTLFNRTIWANPVSNVIGNFGIYKADGTITTECFENLILFIPFTVLLPWNYREKYIGEQVKLGKVLWQSIKIVFLFSFTIEMLKLFLRLGT